MPQPASSMTKPVAVTAPAEVEVIDGRTAYAQLSGRADFFDSLQATMGETFARYKTFAELETLV